jgi:hypothetical protein
MANFIVVGVRLELPRGARFVCIGQVFRSDALCLISIDGHKTIGRYFQSPDGCRWVVQPGCLVRIADDAVVTVLGPVTVSYP